MHDNFLYRIVGVKGKAVSISVDSEYYLLFGFCLPDNFIKSYSEMSNFTLSDKELEVMLQRVRFYVKFYPEIGFSLPLNPTMILLEEITVMKRRLNSRFKNEKKLKLLLTLYGILEEAKSSAEEVAFQFINQDEL